MELMTITVSTFFFVFSELKLEMIVHQFHHYQQNKQSPLILAHWLKKGKFTQSMGINSININKTNNHLLS
jgi:hypothetical protein